MLYKLHVNKKNSQQSLILLKVHCVYLVTLSTEWCKNWREPVQALSKVFSLRMGFYLCTIVPNRSKVVWSMHRISIASLWWFIIVVLRFFVEWSGSTSGVSMMCGWQVLADLVTDNGNAGNDFREEEKVVGVLQLRGCLHTEEDFSKLQWSITVLTSHLEHCWVIIQCARGLKACVLSTIGLLIFVEYNSFSNYWSNTNFLGLLQKKQPQRKKNS